MNELLDIYRRTRFSVKNLEGKLVSFTAEDAADLPFLAKKRFSIITAYNPMNTPTDDSENLKNHLLLKTDLKRLGYEYYETSGILGDHSETSFTIEGISEEEAKGLGVKYGQHAILYNDEKGVRFIQCRRFGS